MKKAGRLFPKITLKFPELFFKLDLSSYNNQPFPRHETLRVQSIILQICILNTALLPIAWDKICKTGVLALRHTHKHY